MANKPLAKDQLGEALQVGCAGIFCIGVVGLLLLMAVNLTNGPAEPQDEPRQANDSVEPLPYETEEQYVRRRALQHMSPAEYEAAKRTDDGWRENGNSDAEIDRAVDAELRRRGESP